MVIVVVIPVEYCEWHGYVTDHWPDPTSTVELNLEARKRKSMVGTTQYSVTLTCMG